MREIGSVADDLDVGGIVEGVFMHIAPNRDAYFGEAGATRESIVPNLRHRWWYGDSREAGALAESTTPNLRHRWGDDGVLTSLYQRIALRMDYGIAILSRIIDLVVLGNGDAREAGATRESPVPDLCHRFWDGDAREAGATRESTQSNLRHRFWYIDACEVGAAFESPVPNLRH